MESTFALVTATEFNDELPLPTIIAVWYVSVPELFNGILSLAASVL
ncbi:MAG: hypothetical protein IPJ75_03850 [Ignavibacteriales bacterium]|nr:hypothetical protein [Ignavibacteriales bacterium]